MTFDTVCPPLSILTKITLILTITLVLALTLASCDSGGGSPSPAPSTPKTPKTDPALDGTWVSESGTKYIFNNGNFETHTPTIPYVKGTFTTSDSTLTITITHVWGEMGGLDAKWYTRAALKAADPTIPDAILDNTFSSITGTYSVSGNTLTLDSDTFTKQ